MFRLFPAPRRHRSASRRARLGLESLDRRDLPSVSLFQAANLGSVASVVYVPPAAPPVPNLAGWSFHLISSNGKPAHDLVIQAETYRADGSATFTGTWHGDGGGGDTFQVMNGTLTRDANGNTAIAFSWNGAHYFNGTITQVTSRYGGVSIYDTYYHLEGDVTVTGNPTGGPGHVSGDGVRPPMVATM
jgi:hypothetical protein